MIDRRILVNFRVRADVLQRMLPAPFKASLVNGWGMAGICLIRLREIRPVGIPRTLGIQSENAAHRIAVEWSEHGRRHEGVFIPRRDTSSWLNRLAGGRLFPGQHHAANFHSEESVDRYRVEMESHDRQVQVRLAGRVAHSLPEESGFASLVEASAFFAKGSVGWSVTGRPGVFDGLELRSLDWWMKPLAVDEVESSFFANSSLFPKNSVQFDNALLMRGLRHEWHGYGVMDTNPTANTRDEHASETNCTGGRQRLPGACSGGSVVGGWLHAHHSHPHASKQ
jgi:hypothetical protein